jgi:hypothetical protein
MVFARAIPCADHAVDEALRIEGSTYRWRTNRPTTNDMIAAVSIPALFAA